MSAGNMKHETISEIKNALSKVKSTIDYIRSSIKSRKCSNCVSCRYLGKLNKELVDLLYFSKYFFPVESDYLMAYLPGLSGVNKINPYDFGGIISIVNIMQAHVNQIQEEDNRIISTKEVINPVKVFISHSSKDKNIVESFMIHVLRLGCGMQSQDILCTSIESTGIRTGEDIRIYLRKQLQSCDYVFFMISDDYIKSSICLNEMGGAWVLEKNIKPLLLPQNDFSDMGWLYEISKGAKLDNEESLDELRDEFLEKYKLIESPKTSDWTFQKRAFLSALKNKTQA